MRIAGVQLDDGRSVWLDAGQYQLSPLDTVTARLSTEKIQGRVFVTPEQLLQPPTSIAGEIIAASPPPSYEDPTDLPGSDMPPLGSRARTASLDGTVTAIDAVHRTVTLTDAEGHTRVVSDESGVMSL